MTPVAITTLVPIEVLFAADCQPLDMNNVFLSDPDWRELVARAEQVGFSELSCAWLKGIYGAMLRHGEIRTIVGVTVGDCTDTHVLLEYLEREGLQVVPFAYIRERLQEEIEHLMRHFGVDWPAVRQWHERLQQTRRLVWRLDELTWQQNTYSGWDNHLYQVCCSDMGGDLEAFERDVRALKPAAAPINPDGVRLGVLGVPSIFAKQLYPYLEQNLGAKVVFNETQRQFSLPCECDMVEQYRQFTYPYGTTPRIADIAAEVQRRDIHGLIHYVQAFCYRELTDALIRRDVAVPVLTIIGNHEQRLDAHVRTRLEAFVDMVVRQRRRHL